MLRKFLKDSGIYGLSGILTKSVSIILIPFYTRVLDPSEYGTMDYITVIGYFLGVFLSLEIYQAVARLYFEFESQDDRRKSVSTGLFYTAAGFGILVLIVFLFSKSISFILFRTTEFRLLIIVASINLLFATIFTYTVNVLRYNLQATKYIICSLINSFFSIGMTIFLVLFLKMGVLGIFYGNLFGNLISLFFTFYYGRDNYRLQFDKTSLVQLLNFSIPLVPASIGVYTMSFVDRFLINHYLNFSEVGIYGIGFRMASVSTLIMSALNSATTPLIYANYKNVDTPSQLSKLFQIVIFGALLSTLIISVFAKGILIIFTTPEYYGAAVVVPLLLANGFLSRLYDYTPGLAIAKKTKTIALIYISGAIFNVLFNFILIPLFGIIGAGLSSILASTFVFFTNLHYSQKIYFIPYKTKILFLSFLSAIVHILIAHFINFENTFLDIAFRVAIITSAVIQLFLIKLIDFRSARNLILSFLHTNQLKEGQ